jgi:hypothetical protein
MDDFVKALKQEFGDNTFTVAQVVDSTIPFRLFPPVVQTSAAAGKSITLSLGHCLRDVEGVTRVGRSYDGLLWSVEDKPDAHS